MLKIVRVSCRIVEICPIQLHKCRNHWDYDAPPFHPDHHLIKTFESSQIPERNNDLGASSQNKLSRPSIKQ